MFLRSLRSTSRYSSKGVLQSTRFLSTLFSPSSPSLTPPRLDSSFAKPLVRQSLYSSSTLVSSSKQKDPATPATAPTATSEYYNMASVSGTVVAEIADLVQQAIATAFPQVKDVVPIVVPCPNPRFGDYQINNAMPLFPKIKGQEGMPKSPVDTAKAIIAAFPPNQLIAESSIAGPGVINLKLQDDYLARRVQQLLTTGPEAFAPRVPRMKCIVDFSSPNVAKEMHVGHLRSTIIGDTLCRVLTFCGHDVKRLNHVGDWGTQFGMLIQFMKEKRSDGSIGSGEEDVADLMELYRASKKRFDEDESFKDRARQAVTMLQGGDEEMLSAWRRICQASRVEFNKLYERLGVTLEERGESFYNPYLQPLLKQMQESGVCIENEGAQVIFTDGIEIPLIMQKTDGGFGYASTDMAALKHRIEEEKANWIIYVTDAGQGVHFKQVFGAARKAGILKAKEEGGPRVDHVAFGLVMGEDGKRLRTRSGDIVRLVELLDEAYDRCKVQIKDKRPDVEDEELEAAAKAMGYGAVKYADLKNNRNTDYRFSFDAMLDLKGNTAVYLLYAHARIASIMRKSGKDVMAMSKTATIQPRHEKEHNLVLHLARFPEVLIDVLNDLLPNRLTEYLYDLSVKYNDFYNNCQVIGSEEEESRLLLCESTAVMMRSIFHLLGITPLYRI